MQQIAKKQFFPPRAFVVETTKLLFPSKPFTSYEFSILTQYTPFLSPFSKRPQSLRKLGSPAVLIQTIKCSVNHLIKKSLPSVISSHQIDFHLFTSSSMIFLNFQSLSLSQEIPVELIFCSSLFKQTVYESVKTLLATRPQGMAGSSGFNVTFFQNALRVGLISLFNLIGSQSFNFSTGKYFPLS